MKQKQLLSSLKPWKGHSDVVKVLFVKTKPIQNQKAPFILLQYSENAMQIDNSTLLIK